MRHTLVIPDWLPARLNVLLRAHWSKRRRLLRADADVVGWYFRGSGIPRATGKRRVSVRFTEPRAADPDARLKGLLDALVACAAIREDSPKWLELGKVVSAKGPRRTVITLTDL